MVDTRAKELVKEIHSRIEELGILQRNCFHNWLMVESPELAPSLKEGVYIGSTQGPISSSLHLPKLGMRLECTGCLVKRTTTQIVTCPICFRDLVDGKMCWREEVFGIPYIYFGVRIRVCLENHFSIGCDEWDH